MLSQVEFLPLVNDYVVTCRILHKLSKAHLNSVKVLVYSFMISLMLVENWQLARKIYKLKLKILLSRG